ncbi:MAG: hypothetical protein IJS78_03525 [Clostridia bacterium]|nr:hypothetical protein [Clostridia bacterium]
MRPEDILSAVGQLDDDMIAGTEKTQAVKRPPARYFIIVAAAIVLLAAVALFAGLNTGRPRVPSPIASDFTDGTVSPQSESVRDETGTRDSPGTEETTDETDIADGTASAETTDDGGSEYVDPVVDPDPYVDPFSSEPETADPPPASGTVKEDDPPVGSERATEPAPVSESGSQDEPDPVTGTESETDPIATDPGESTGPEPVFDPDVNIYESDVREFFYDLNGSPVYYVQSYNWSEGPSFQGMQTEKLPRSDSINRWWGEFCRSPKSNLRYFRLTGGRFVTRADAAVILYGLAKYLDADIPDIREYQGFTDANRHQGLPIRYVYEKGLLDPVSEERFGAEEYVTREEFVAAAQTIAGYAGTNQQEVNNEENG